MSIAAILSTLVRPLRQYLYPVCITNLLPYEVLGLVFDFLQLDELLLASQTCQDWRTIIVRVAPELTLADARAHLDACARG